MVTMAQRIEALRTEKGLSRPALAAALGRFGMDAERFYLAVADGGDRPGQMIPGKACVRVQKGLLCSFLERPLTQAQAEATVARHQLNGLGYLTAPSRPDTLAQDLRTAVSMAMHRFMTGRRQAVCRCGTEDRNVLAGLQDAMACQDDIRLTQLLRDMQLRLPDISVGCAFRMSNMLHNYRFASSFEEEESGYAYDLSHLLSMYGNVQEMLADLVRLVEEPSPPVETGFESGNVHFLQIIRYIHRHYADDLSLNTLAEVLHMTPGYVSRLFSRESGTTYRKYLTELRVEKAKELLSVLPWVLPWGFRDDRRGCGHRGHRHNPCQTSVCCRPLH